MIEAQRSNRPHVVANQDAEGLVLLRMKLGRVLRRNAPILTLERQCIRRRANGGIA